MRNHPVSLALAVLLFVAAFPTPAASHDLPRERTLLVQFRPDAIDVMVVYLEPPTASLQLFKARYDLDRDGKIDDQEALFATDAWLPRATQNLTFKWNGHRLEPSERPKLKFSTEHHGALASALLLTYDLPDDDPFDPGTFTIHRADPNPAPERSDFPTLVRFQLTRHLAYDQLPDNASTPDDSTRTSAIPLQPGHSLSTHITHNTTSPHTDPTPH